MWKTYLLGGTLTLMGITLMFFGLTVNALTGDVIENTQIAISNGLPMQSVMEPILGLLADGFILNVPTWVAQLSAVVGVLLAYFGIHTLIHAQKGGAKQIFSRAYWRHFDLSFSYTPTKKKGR